MKIINLGFATCFAISLVSTRALAKTELTAMNNDCLKFSYQATQQVHDVDYRELDEAAKKFKNSSLTGPNSQAAASCVMLKRQLEDANAVLPSEDICGYISNAWLVGKASPDDVMTCFQTIAKMNIKTGNDVSQICVNSSITTMPDPRLAKFRQDAGVSSIDHRFLDTQILTADALKNQIYPCLSKLAKPVTSALSSCEDAEERAKNDLSLYQQKDDQGVIRHIRSPRLQGLIEMLKPLVGADPSETVDACWQRLKDTRAELSDLERQGMSGDFGVGYVNKPLAEDLRMINSALSSAPQGNLH
jgi:hypothetical protein